MLSPNFGFALAQGNFQSDFPSPRHRLGSHTRSPVSQSPLSSIFLVEGVACTWFPRCLHTMFGPWGRPLSKWTSHEDDEQKNQPKEGHFLLQRDGSANVRQPFVNRLGSRTELKIGGQDDAATLLRWSMMVGIPYKWLKVTLWTWRRCDWCQKHRTLPPTLIDWWLPIAQLCQKAPGMISRVWWSAMSHGSTKLSFDEVGRDDRAAAVIGDEESTIWIWLGSSYFQTINQMFNQMLS